MPVEVHPDAHATEPSVFTAQGPSSKLTGIERGYVVVQPFTHNNFNVTASSMPSLLTVSDSSSEISDVSSTTEDDFQYPSSQLLLPKLSPPTEHFANLRTTDVAMTSPSPSPTPRHSYVSPPTTDEDPEVHFLINLLRLQVTDIINRCKSSQPRTTHIVESAPTPPYDPFADLDDIYAEDVSCLVTPTTILQPQPRRAQSLPTIDTLTAETQTTPEPVLPASPAASPHVSANLPSQLVSPVIHLRHDFVDWSWTHPPTEDNYVSAVPYNTGHSPHEAHWPKVVPLDDSGFANHQDTYEITEPPRPYNEGYYRHRLFDSIRKLRPNLEFLAH